MNQEEFQSLVDLSHPYLAPSGNAARLDSLTVDKKVALCLYYLKDKAGYRMTCKTFGVSIPALSTKMPQFCKAVIKIGENIFDYPKRMRKHNK